MAVSIYIIPTINCLAKAILVLILDFVDSPAKDSAAPAL